MTHSQRFPPGWDAARVQRVLDHYDSQSDEEAVAEDEASLAGEDHVRRHYVVADVPTAL